jgi:endonuclease/exonuclease/phosphatase family metal-dependent hydrolase
MKKNVLPIILYGLLFLLFIQLAGTLVSSIYTLDLLHTSLDAKVLGLLFFFGPVVFLVARKQVPGLWKWIFFGILFLARGLTPGLDTNGRMLASGLGSAACLWLFPLVVTAGSTEVTISRKGFNAGLGMALAVTLSVMLRTMNSSIDYSLTVSGSWAGWCLVLLFGIALAGMEEGRHEDMPASMTSGTTASILGIFLVLIMFYLTFSAPAVIARWTEGNYAGIVLSTSLISSGWFALVMFKPDLLTKLSNRVLIVWNLLFSVAVVATTLAHRVSFPAGKDSAAVVVSPPTFLQQVPLVLMLILFPVLFFDMYVFWTRLAGSGTQPRKMVPGMLLGSFTLILLVFMNIFSNVWGYVEPVSPFFRNKFWLPYVIIGGLLLLLVALHPRIVNLQESRTQASTSRLWGLILVAILVVTANGLFVPAAKSDPDVRSTSLKVMTYNIQQANNNKGEQSYLDQLALIRQVDPDILALQETDSTRISLNNVDYVRYYADKLGYYSYYGPTTITGGYGTSILSRFPLQDPISIFTFSDQDENGTAYARIEVDGKKFNIYNVHPDGSDDAKLAFANMLLQRSASQSHVIILGDFNLRDYEIAYQMIDSVFINSWISVYPTGISNDGVDMSGENRIDHIFISKDLQALDPVYLLPPASATDHPAHWATILWNN